MTMRITHVAFCLLLLCSTGAIAQEREPVKTEFLAPQPLTFDELAVVSKTANPEGALGERLHSLLTIPFVSNAASASGIKPRRPSGETLGPMLRVTLWNIERGLNFDLIEAALAGDSDFERFELKNTSANDRQIVASQLRTLQGADVVLLNEVDLGMKRTEYRDVAQDLARALRMNYTFGVEFVEVDPLFDLGLEQVDIQDPQVEQRIEEDLKVDRSRYKGLHGNAILSRYPIRNARILRLPVCYDWYRRETEAISKLEGGKRWSAKTLFRERVGREVRHGGRMALIADLAVPGLPTGTVTFVAAHLENKCAPKCRQQQTDALLAAIKDVKNPVVLAGDLNTTGSDAAPTSVRNEIMKRVKDYQFWIGQALTFLNPLSLPQYALVSARYVHGYLDPTAFHLPIVWKNDERGLFKLVERFRFLDGYAFDFRGQTERTLNQKARTLANSNQRGLKGFVPTFAFERDFGGLVGRFKLDWFFVKPFIQNPYDKKQSYRFAPHYPITMRALNESVEGRISDHPPLTVDLPFEEPGK